MKITIPSVEPRATDEPRIILDHEPGVDMEIKPCPFCGARAAFDVIDRRDLTIWLTCCNQRCNAQGPKVNKYSYNAQSENWNEGEGWSKSYIERFYNEAIKRWNREK